jgi:hypothetical protein
MRYQRYAILLLLAFCAVAVQAQSGRRQVKPPPAAPIPTPTPEPTPQPKAQEPESDLGFIIGSDRFGFDNYPISYYEAAMQGCADRLRSGSSAAVSVAQGNMNRSEAIKKAKGETETYIVYLRLVLDQTYARSLDDLEIEFVAFAPKTAKVVVNGRSYLNANRKGPIIVPNTRGQTGALYREELIRRAGEDAGSRILKALHLDTPVLR